MRNNSNFNSQSNLSLEHHLKGIRIGSWYRYYFIVKEVIDEKPKNILEIGIGNKIVKNCLEKLAKNYQTMDINPKLNPDVLSDIREFKLELKEKFECIICSEILEHIPFSDLEGTLVNLYNYLTNGGKLMITVPHRQARIVIILPLSTQKPLVINLPSWLRSSLKSFYQQFIRNKKWIDIYHYWEVGDGRVKKEDIENIMKRVNFKIEKFEKLHHNDFWVLTKY